MSEHPLRLSDGATIRLRRCGRAEGPRLLVGHGTGFSIDGFRRLWQPLEEDCDLVLFDLRGHGRNPPAAPESVTGARLVEDMREIVAGIAAAFGAKPLHGLCHSISAVMALRLESLAPSSFASLVLMEPPAMPPESDPGYADFESGRLALETRTLKRQARFASVAELAEKFQGRGPFRRFEPGAAEELAAGLLVPDGDGFRLACPPEVEARFFGRKPDDGLRARLGDVGCPVTLIVGRDDLAFPGSPASIGVELARAGGFDLVELADATHMMPLERPAAIRALTRALIAQASRAR